MKEFGLSSINYTEPKKMFLSRGMTRFIFIEIICGGKEVFFTWLESEGRNVCQAPSRTFKETAEVMQENNEGHNLGAILFELSIIYPV